MLAVDDWYVVDLGDAITADVQLERLKIHLEKSYQSMDHLLPVAAYYRYESQGLHCHTMLYLTASFQQVADISQAELCMAPTSQGLMFLAGDVKFRWATH